ncbi:LRRK2 [Mytilus edulis]|uniref:LRRK2 n=1 Tax=Mytilus edulis TaxID=6550 RepID=A0A8S3SLN7_MYTED|nr:LRRK2 [Mytilus edulis]
MVSKVGKKMLHNKKIAPVIIWDFGGQDVFYSTHQTFLTYRALYMIVLDGSRKLDDPCPHKTYLPGKSGDKTARDYLRFWINTIVTYCKGSVEDFPKIMIVLTHKDKVQSNEVENRKSEIFREIKNMIKHKPFEKHLVIDELLFVNAKDRHDLGMERIKDVIRSQSEKQPTWGEPLPKCFITLELEFASLIKRNIPLITLEHLNEINSLQSIRPLSETELKNKDYLLGVMTHLDILVEPTRYDSNHTRIPADFYYVASMVRANDNSGYLQSADLEHRSIAIVFQSSSSVIPPALSFRFLCNCLSVWALKKFGQDNKSMLFYRSGCLP